MALIKTVREMELLREGGKILAEILRKLTDKVKVGVSTQSLEDEARRLISQAGASPAFLGYKGFSSALCASLNEEIVHAPAGKDRELKDGDILSLDLGIKYKGLFTDAAVTMPVGQISAEAQKLIRATREALAQGIAQVRPGNTIGDIASAIEQVGKRYGLGVIRELVGHGVGHDVHEAPEIPNYGKPGTLQKLQAGMVLAIEPMLALGDWRIKTLPDKWTIATRDGSLSAHFEHTVAVTKSGYLVLTDFFLTD